MVKGIIVGKETSTYTDKQSGEIKISRKLHVLLEAPRRPSDGFIGQKVITESIPFPVDDVKVGDVCFFDYDVQSTRSGTFARLVDVDVIGRIDMDAFTAATTPQP